MTTARIRCQVLEVPDHDDWLSHRSAPPRELLPWADPYIAGLMRRLDQRFVRLDDADACDPFTADEPAGMRDFRRRLAGGRFYAATARGASVPQLSARVRRVPTARRRGWLGRWRVSRAPGRQHLFEAGQILDQIGRLLSGHVAEQQLGHQRFLLRHAALDFGGGKGGLLAVGFLQDDFSIAPADQQPGNDFPVLRLDQVRDELRVDRFRRLQNAFEQLGLVELLADLREIRTECLPLIADLMAVLALHAG